jgi:hypothetical protein
MRLVQGHQPQAFDQTLDVRVVQRDALDDLPVHLELHRRPGYYRVARSHSRLWRRRRSALAPEGIAPVASTRMLSMRYNPNQPD